MIILLTIPILAWANFLLATNVSESTGILRDWTVRNGFLVEAQEEPDPETEAAVERSFARYPLATLLARRALGLLPYLATRAAWMTMLSVALVASVFLGFAAADWTPSFWVLAIAALFSLLSYHAIRGIVEGQFAILQGVLIMGGLIAFRRHQDELAGLLFAISVLDPWLMVIFLPLIIAYSASKRRWTVVMWMLAGVAVITAFSILQEPTWPRRWLVSLVAPSEPSGSISITARIADSLFAGTGAVAWILTFVAGVYLLWEWSRTFGREEHRFLWVAALTITIGVIILPAGSPSSYLILLPILTFAIGLAVHRWGRSGQVGGAIALMVLLIASWTFAATTFGEDLPLQLIFPLFALIGLLWMRWWSTRAYRLPQ